MAVADLAACEGAAGVNEAVGDGGEDGGGVAVWAEDVVAAVAAEVFEWEGAFVMSENVLMSTMGT